MKKSISQLTFVIFLVGFLIPNYLSAQGILITKSADTIHYVRIDDSRYPNYKYWTSENSKPQKIKSSEIGNRFLIPEYVLTKNEIDEFTDDFKRFSKYISIGGTKPDKRKYSGNLVVWMGKVVSSSDKSYAIYLRTPMELGCSGSDKNYVMIKFNDNEVITLENDIAEIDCGKNAVSTYLLPDNVLNKFRNDKIKSVRFQQSEFYADFYVIFPDCLIKTMQIIDD
jgi:hypothetical protein